MMVDGDRGIYGRKTLRIEPYGIEHIPPAERHGSPGRLFTLWFASNVTIGSYAVGYLAVSSFGLPIVYALLALLIANLTGGVLLGLASAMGATFGYPQMIISRMTFGRRGGYLPAALQWASSIGWFTVNAVLGAFALNEVAHIGYVQSAAVLLAAMILIGLYGHNFIHQFEKIMAAVLGAFFAVATVLVLMHSGSIARYVPSFLPGTTSFGVNMVLLAGASLSYLMSWAPYASDYSRYLNENTEIRRSFTNTFFGGMLASFWFEALGALVAAFVYGTVAAPGNVGITESVGLILGALGSAGLVAIVLGSLAANALNIYTSALTSLVLDIRIRRWMAVILSGAVGSFLTIAVAGTFTSFYEGFLLLLDYWITPWLAIILIDFYVLKRRDYREVERAPAFGTAAILSYLLGLASSIPFISWYYTPQLHYTGIISATYLGGADISYYVALAITSASYLFLGRRYIMRRIHGEATSA